MVKFLAEMERHKMWCVRHISKSPPDFMLRGFFKWKIIQDLTDTHTNPQQHMQGRGSYTYGYTKHFPLHKDSTRQKGSQH